LDDVDGKSASKQAEPTGQSPPRGIAKVGRSARHASAGALIQSSRDDGAPKVQRPFLREHGEQVTRDQVTVVIPTLNEAEGIGSVLDDLKEARYNNVLVVDGDSTDGTVEIAEKKGTAVVMQHGPGKAGALKTAIGMVATEYMAVMDGDCTYRAADLDSLLAYAREYDEVVGARVDGRENIPRMNRFGNWVISRVFKLLFGTPISDVLSGMYLMKTEKAREMELSSVSFDIEVEIASAMATGGKVTQVPISYGRRVGSQKLRPSHGGRIVGTLFWMAYYYNPVILFGGLVSLAAIPAAGILLWVLFEGFFLGVWHSIYAILGVALLLLASQAAAISLTSLLIKRSEQRIMSTLSRIQSKG
jgi:dolichol-phosphate hexosyltransferase